VLTKNIVPMAFLKLILIVSIFLLLINSSDTNTDDKVRAKPLEITAGDYECIDRNTLNWIDSQPRVRTASNPAPMKVKDTPEWYLQENWPIDQTKIWKMIHITYEENTAIPKIEEDGVQYTCKKIKASPTFYLQCQNDKKDFPIVYECNVTVDQLTASLHNDPDKDHKVQKFQNRRKDFKQKLNDEIELFKNSDKLYIKFLNSERYQKMLYQKFLEHHKYN